MLAALQLILTIAIAVALPLLWRYLGRRVEEIAREGTERALADYRAQHDQVLAAVNAEHQRRHEEFSLYTRQQHRVYAALYRRVREAADRYRGLVGLTMSPDFSRFTVEKAGLMLASWGFDEASSAAPLDAYRRGDLSAAERLMHNRLERYRLHKADEAFRRAKNLEALHELYLSDAVRGAMDVLRARMGKVSTALEAELDDRHRERLSFEQMDALEIALHDVFRLMRDELRRGRPAEAAAPPAD